MHDLGCDPQNAAVIIGTSAGSIMAATLRHRSRRQLPLPDPEPRRRLPTRTDALSVLRRPRQAFNALLLAPEILQGRTSTEFISEALRRRYGISWPEAALWIVAVRRRDGRRVVFGKPGEPATDVASAVAASCAIPAYFTAVDIGGDSFVDGGLHSPTNADLLAGYPLDLVIVSSPMSVGSRRPAARVDAPFRLLFRRYLQHEVWTLRRRGTQVVTIEPDRAVLRAMGINMMSARHCDEVEDRAYELALGQLQREVFAAASGRRSGRGRLRIA